MSIFFNLIFFFESREPRNNVKRINHGRKYDFRCWCSGGQEFRVEGFNKEDSRNIKLEQFLTNDEIRQVNRV